MIVIFGISGSGKSTIGRYLEEKGYQKLVTTTSRKQREGEVEGKDYFFVSKDEFEKNIENYMFVTNYVNNFYGINKTDLTDADKKYIILDYKGVEEIKGELKEKAIVLYVYITIEEMIKRLKMRGEDNDTIKKRLDTDMPVYSNSHLAYDHIIINMEEQFNEIEKQIDTLLKKIEG